MRVVIDGLAIHGENSLSIVSENLLSAWQRMESPGDGPDDLHLVVQADPSISVPESVTVHPVRFGRSAFVSRLHAQSVLLPRLCRAVQADVLLAMLPTTALTPLPCPHAVIAWDFRYRFLPEQFSRKTLLKRRVSYVVGFRRADAVACISERTKRDLLRFHHRLSKVPVEVALLGADHVDSWPVDGLVREADDRYAIAFGHFANKNVDLVLSAWSALQQRGGSTLSLRLVGVSERDRPRLEHRIDELGLRSVATLSPWLATNSFREQFASSSLVVFPSDFEGFGLPAVEAMRLGVPLVVSSDPALLEVTGGHATVVDDDGPEALVRAVDAALRMPEEELAVAKRHAERFTWVNFASGVRKLLADAVSTTTSTGTQPVPQSRAATA